MSLAVICSIIGGALILAAFIALQLGRVTADNLVYLALNAGGSGVLVASALLAELWGFLVLNLVWGGVSAWGLVSSKN